MRNSLSFGVRRIKYGFLALILLTTISILLWHHSSNSASAQLDGTALASPFESRELVIGVRTAAYEIGHDVREDGSGGFCGVFGEVLKDTLSNRNITTTYLPVENNYLDGRWERYDSLREGVVHVECGPNSRPSGNPIWARGITFSDTPFHVSGVKLLLRKSTIDELSSRNLSLEELADQIKVAVVENTTTLRLLNSIPEIETEETEGRDRALDLLERRENYAYASDALILKTLLNKGAEEIRGTNNEIIQKGRAPYKNDDYITYPEDQSYIGNVSREEYVIAIRKGTSYEDELMDAIEDTLNSNTINEKRQQLTEAETSLAISSPNADRPLFDIPSWLVILGALFLLISATIAIALFSNKSKNNRPSPTHEPQSPEKQPSPYVVVHASPSIHNNSTVNTGQQTTFQGSTADEDLKALSVDIRKILNLIDSSGNPTDLSQAKARVKGAEICEQNSSLKMRLAKALQTSSMEILKSYIKHPLAIGFLKGFEEMLKR